MPGVFEEGQGHHGWAQGRVGEHVWEVRGVGTGLHRTYEGTLASVLIAMRILECVFGQN